MNRISLEQELLHAGTVVFRSSGNSMLPLIRENRDLLVLDSVKDMPLKKYDIVLYRRKNGQLVLHRIIDITQGSFTMRGDNVVAKEYGVKREQIIGKLARLKRDEVTLEMDSPMMRYYGQLISNCSVFKRVLSLYNLYYSWSQQQDFDNNDIFEKDTFDLLYLMGCAFSGRELDVARVDKMDLPSVLKKAKAHAVLSQFVDLFPENPFVQQEYYQVLKRSVLFDNERKKIEFFLQQNGIPYVLLKGIVLKNLYAKQGMRYLTDNDIWIRESDKGFIKHEMESLGYTAEHYNVSNHDVYFKPPIYNFEFHNNLFNKEYNQNWHKYYQQLFDDLIHLAGDSSEHFLKSDDYYVYFMAHLFKHFSNCSIGFRALADEFVLLKKNPVEDEKYVQTQLSQLGLLEFEKDIRQLTNQIFSSDFSEDTLSLSQREMLKCFATANANGTLTNSVRKQLRDSQGSKNSLSAFIKVKYLMDRVFSTNPALLKQYPLVDEHRILLPAFWMWRIIVRIKNDWKRAAKEVLIVFKS